MGPYISGGLDGKDSDRYRWVRTHTEGFCNSRFLTEMFKSKIGIFEILGRCLIGFVGEGTELALTRFDPYL